MPDFRTRERRDGTKYHYPVSGSKQTYEQPEMETVRVSLPTREYFTIYHVTFSDRADSIMREGFIARKFAPAGQPWLPVHIGAYGFVSLEQARNSIEDAVETTREIDEGFSEKDYAILKISVPIDEWENRLRPDEDWSLNKEDWRDYKKEGCGVILGNIPKEYIKRLA